MGFFDERGWSLEWVSMRRSSPNTFAVIRRGLRIFFFLKAFGLSYESRQMNPITQTSYCVFKRSQKLMDVVEFWNECRNNFRDYDENGNRADKAGD